MRFGIHIWSEIQDKVGQFGTWLGSLVTGIGTDIMTAIKSGVDFGAYLVSSITSAAGNIGTAILSALKSGEDFGAYIVSSVTAAAGNIASAFGAAFAQIKITVAGQTITLAGGGVVSSVPGGVPALIGEAGQSEAVIPESMWWGVNPAVLNALPHFGGGGVIGNVSTSAVTQPSGSAKNENVYYNLYVTVDSEGITNKVFGALRELEAYHHI